MRIHRCLSASAVVVVAMVAAASPAASQSSGKSGVRIEGVTPGTSVMLDINGAKPPGSDTVASPSGVADITLNLMDMSKPEGFKGQVFIDTCPTGVNIRIVSEGPVPAPGADCRRRRAGIFGFRPDGVTTFNVGGPTPNVLIGGLGGGIGSDTSNMDFTRSLEVWRGTIGNNTLPEERSSEVSRKFDNEAGITGSTTEFAFPFGDGIGLRNAGLFAGTSAASRSRSRTLAHHAILSVGRGSAELDYHNTENRAESTHWTGSGPLWGVGYGAIVELCDGCNWFANASYVYSRMQPTNMKRGRSLDLEGGRLVRDEAKFEWHAHLVEATIGRATSHVYPYAGVRTGSRRARLAGDVEVDYSSVFGFNAQQHVTFDNEFEKTTVQAIAGAQIRIPNTRLFVRAEGAAGSGSNAFGINVGYGWFR